MNYLKQFLIILSVSFLGEVLHGLLPWPIPASIYGMVLRFLSLLTGLIKLEQVQDAASLVYSILPMLCVAPAVKLLDCWEQVAPFAFQIVAIIVVSTVVTFAVAGKITAGLMNRKKGEKVHG